MKIICRLDRKIYACVADDIVSEDVVLMDERIVHIRDHHPGDFEKYSRYICVMIEQPDYIIDSEKPKTAFVLKEFVQDGEHFRLILRLHTSTDDPAYENSVITFQHIREREYLRLVRNKKILYKREGL